MGWRRPPGSPALDLWSPPGEEVAVAYTMWTVVHGSELGPGGLFFFPTYYSILFFLKVLPIILFILPIILFIVPTILIKIHY